MVTLIEKCKPFCDFGMKSQILIPEQIYDDFNNAISSVMMLLFMSEYRCVYSSSSSRNIHYFKFMKERERHFTITIHNDVDRYRSMLNVSISYHCHNQQNIHDHYKFLFGQMFSDLGTIDDNAIIFEDENCMIEGLKRFSKIV